jgi:uncharacterized repeat protein (TIGR03803 family)
LYSFTCESDGCTPYPGVVLDSAGNLYGSAFYGGAAFGNSGYGVIFKLDTTGALTVLHTFDLADGANPSSVLLFDSQGNLYGTTQNGGNSECGGTGCGVVFELSPQSGGGWLETVLYVQDSSNSYVSAVGPTVQSAASSPTAAQIFYAKKTVSGSGGDILTVTYSVNGVPTNANTSGCVFVEYQGADQNYPLDSVSEAISNSGSPSGTLDSGTASPANANLLVFGGGTSDITTGSANAGHWLHRRSVEWGQRHRTEHHRDHV